MENHEYYVTGRDWPEFYAHVKIQEDLTETTLPKLHVSILFYDGERPWGDEGRFVVNTAIWQSFQSLDTWVRGRSSQDVMWGVFDVIFRHAISCRMPCGRKYEIKKKTGPRPLRVVRLQGGD